MFFSHVILGALMLRTMLLNMMKAKRAKQSKGVCSEEKMKALTVSADRISELQDDLLLILLSHLTFKEATATSILCRRWRYLCTFTRNLDFDGSKTKFKLRKLKLRKEGLEEERCKFVRWVDNVLASHKGSAIDEFRVVFDLDKAFENSIDEWLRFVLARKVQKLELNLKNDFAYQTPRYTDECYTFPYRSLVFSDSWCDLFKYLRKLTMNDVNVDGEAVEELLVRKCPLLEHLSVSYSQQLTNLKIISPFPSFKYLEVRWCFLESIEVRDANLVGLTYVGSRIEFVLENVPLLVEMFIGGGITQEMKGIVLALSSYLPRLEIFSICTTCLFDIYSEKKDTEFFYSTVKMSKLKQLRVLVGVEKLDDKDFSLMWVSYFLRASPCLERFVLEVLRYDPPMVISKRKPVSIETPHVHLKEVKFVGYCGNTSDFELVMHFLNNAPSLEKLVVDPSQPCESLPLPYEFPNDRQSAEEKKANESEARIRAKKQFPNIKLHPRIDFQIL